MLAGSLAMNATTRYFVPVSDPTTLASGDKIIIEAYTTANEEQRLLTISADESSTSWYTKTEIINNSELTSDNVIWTYTPVTDVTCSNTTHSASSGTFNLTHGEKYWSVEITGSSFPTSYATTTVGTNATNYFELVDPATQPSSTTGSHFFGIHYYKTSGTAYFEKYLGIQTSGNYGFGSSAVDGAVNTAINGSWTYMFRVYKVVETQDDTATDIISALKNDAKAKIQQMKATNVTKAEDMDTYLGKVEAVNCETVEATITELDAIVKEYAAAYYAQFNGKYYTIKNAATPSVYMSTDATQTYRTFDYPSVNSVWKIEYVYDETKHKYCCTLYNEHAKVYLGSIASFTQNARVPASATAVNYELLPTGATATNATAENSWTLSSTAFYSDHSFVHSNNGNIVYWTNTADASRWIIEEASEELVAALNADKTRVYVPVTSQEQIVEGGKYIVESYNTSNTEMRVLTMNGSNQVTFQTPSDMMQDANFTLDKTIWTLHKATTTTTTTDESTNESTTTTSDLVCGTTSHGNQAYYLVSDGHYATLPNGTSAVSTFNTATAEGTTQSQIEFFKQADTDDTFGIHYYHGTTQRRYLGVEAAGAMNFWTKTGDTDGVPSTSTSGTSTHFRLYRVYNSESEAPSGSTATSLLTKMKETAETVVNSYATTITDFNTTAKPSALTSISDAASNSETTLEEVGNIMTTAVNTAIDAYWEKFNGLYVTIQAHNGSYANVTEDATYLTVSNTPTSDVIWKLERVSGTSQFKIYNPLHELYINSLTTWSSNKQIPVADTGVNYLLELQDTTDKVALATTIAISYKYWHLNTTNSPDPCYWNTGDNSTWTMTPATDDQKTILDYNITARKQNSYIGTDLNQYTIDADHANTFATDYTTLKNATTLTTDVTNASTEMTSIFNSNKTINLPANGRYIRIKTAPMWSAKYASAFSNSQPYLTCVNNSANSSASFVTNLDSPENLANSIFLFTDDSKLLAYASGRYGIESHLHFDSSADGSTNTTTQAATFVFAAASAETGAYTMKYGSRYAYTGAGTSSSLPALYTNSGTGTDTNGGYYFQLEYVSELPVTTNADGFATLKVPVAVTIPAVDGAEFYVGKIDDTTLTLHQAQAGETYAANTGIIVNAEASTTINFAIAAEGIDATDGYTTAFQGSNVAQQVSNLATDGKTVYANTESASADDSATAEVTAVRRRAANADSTTSITFTKLADSDVIGANAAMLALASDNTWAENDVVTMPLSATETEDATFNVVNGETVGITTVVVEHADGTSEVYDLQGRRVNPANLRRGIYIVNGQKVRK
jgi:hypothetical protein